MSCNLSQKKFKKNTSPAASNNSLNGSAFFVTFIGLDKPGEPVDTFIITNNEKNEYIIWFF